MLSNIASYLGYPTVADQPPKMDVSLRAIEGDDDWILVEKDEQDQELGQVGGREGVTRVTLAISTLPATPCPQQESWYLTPPPSFTSQGPVHMETSPLENLLIEHPSMSVYQHSRPSQDETITSLPSSSQTLQKLPKKEKLNKIPRNKLNSKFSKKLSNKRPQMSSSEEVVAVNSEEENGYSEKKIKSPKRSIHHLLKNPFSTSDEETISIPSGIEEQTVKPRRLYSEVLGTKVKSEASVAVEKVKEEPSAPVQEQSVQVIVEEVEVGRTNMSVEETPTSEQDRERKRAVQTISGQQQQRQHTLTRCAQKTEQRKTCDTMKRNSMGRNNKAREINSRNKRQRRADMMQRHSGANNNRKSC